MANSDKIMHFANFNITYGAKEEPMLIHFEDIIYPAFIADYKRWKEGETSQFYFSDVKIKRIGEEYVLVGNYIKDTQYNVHTTIHDGELVSTPSIVPTAPYSRFIVFLKNHRMILVRNESQSPDIRSFQATVRYLVNKYTKDKNSVMKEKEERLPTASINIVDIPLRKDVKEALKEVEKIKSLNIRFFPMNNDINPIPIANDIDREMKKIGSKRASLRFNSPESKEEVERVISDSAGLAVSTLEVKYENGNVAKIKEGQISSSTRINLSGDIQEENDVYIVEQAKIGGAISNVSDDNQKLYERFKEAIAVLIK